MSDIKVSIIVLGYNGEKYLRDAFDSLFNLNFSKDYYEIIYVDNGSTDNSCKIAEEYQNKYKNIRVIRNKSNLGFSAGNNIGIRVAKGKYVALFNQDAIAEKGWLRELVELMEQDQKIGAVGGKIFYYNSNDLQVSGAKVYYGGFSRSRALSDEEGSIDYVSGCAMLIRKRLLDEVGLLDEDLTAYYEETDLCSRIRKGGYKIYYTPRAVVWHNTPKRSKRLSQYTTYHMHRNRVIYCCKNYKHKNIFLALDLLFFFNIFALYEFVRAPANIRFIKDVLRARSDSLKYCLRRRHH